jgi:hypothetical protein
MGFAGHVQYKGKMWIHMKCYSKSLKRRDQLGDLGVSGG